MNISTKLTRLLSSGSGTLQNSYGFISNQKLSHYCTNNLILPTIHCKKPSLYFSKHNFGIPTLRFYNNDSWMKSDRALEVQPHQDAKRFDYRIALILASGIVVFLSSRRLFHVEAAKPFIDYDSKGGTEINDRINYKDINNNVKDKKKTNRERFNFLADVVELVTDTVVCIEVKDHTSIDWFTGVPQTISNGSGFIVKSDGLILTNAHVVAGSYFSVRMSDGRTFSAHVEDIDHNADLATLRINANNLPTMPLGNSSDIKLGEWVIAVGSPLALTNTITAGVISSVSREAKTLGLRNDISYIQTDAAITFGNSGGPLINLDGEAIGINFMKVAAGISFAIPMDYAKLFLAKAETRRQTGIKKEARKYLGISILTLTNQIKHWLEARGDYSKAQFGVVVCQVVLGSPAYLAGIQPGDIIFRVNNMEIKTAAQFYDAMKTFDKLVIHVQRGEKVYAANVTPELLPEN